MPSSADNGCDVEAELNMHHLLRKLLLARCMLAQRKGSALHKQLWVVKTIVWEVGNASEEWLDFFHLTRTTPSSPPETVAYPEIVLFFSKYHLRGLKLWSFRAITKIETNHFLELKAFIFSYWNLISSCQTKIIIQSKHVVTLPEGAAAGNINHYGSISQSCFMQHDSY